MKRKLLLWQFSLLLPLLAGCQRSPDYSIFGSFFPVWIFCLALGILGAFLVRQIAAKKRFSDRLAPHIVVYPCLALLIACLLWLVFFS